MANAFCHVELATDDPGKAKEFYAGLFNWGMNDMEMGENTYTMIEVGDEDGAGGGIMAKPCEDAPTAWMAYVQVDDLDGAVEKTQSLGGSIVKAKTEIPNMGWLSVITDPQGAYLGLWQPMSN